ncbi:MAG: 50S ribosomal protein L6, partial [Elusimicrobiota bacterium]
ENSGKKLSHTIPQGIEVRREENRIIVERKAETSRLRGLHGLTRSLINNMIVGVDSGFKKRLQIVGRGKRAKVQGNKIVLDLGFSHSVNYVLPKGVEASVEKNIIQISGFDKQKVGETAAEIRDIQPPEPYKGAGIRYEGERIRKKAGKSAIGGGFTGAGK